jgi:hypothetical protein
MLVGLTALSVLVRTKFVALWRSETSGDRLRAKAVVLDGLAGVELHQRDVFLGGVDDHLGPVLREDRVHPSGVGDLADPRLLGNLGKPAAEVPLDSISTGPVRAASLAGGAGRESVTVRQSTWQPGIRHPEVWLEKGCSQKWMTGLPTDGQGSSSSASIRRSGGRGAC